MANTSEELINSTLPSPLIYVDCSKSNPLSYIFVYFIKLVSAILGTAAHFWCLRFYLCRTVCKFTPTHVFFLNNNIMELMYCLQCLPETLNVFVFKNDLYYKFLFFFFALSWTGRPLLQSCICIEQYLAVLYPLTFLRYKAIKYRIAVAASTWFLAIGYGVYTINLQTFPDTVFNCVFFIAVSVILYCCVSVMYALKQSSKRVSNNTDRYVGNQQKRNVFNTIFSALLITLVIYFPQIVFSFLAIAEIYQNIYYCNILSFISILNSWSVLITPFMKIYKEGGLKLNGIICRSVE